MWEQFGNACAAITLALDAQWKRLIDGLNRLTLIGRIIFTVMGAVVLVIGILMFLPITRSIFHGAGFFGYVALTFCLLLMVAGAAGLTCFLWLEPVPPCEEVPAEAPPAPEEGEADPAI